MAESRNATEVALDGIMADLRTHLDRYTAEIRDAAAGSVPEVRTYRLGIWDPTTYRGGLPALFVAPFEANRVDRRLPGLQVELGIVLRELHEDRRLRHLLRLTEAVLNLLRDRPTLGDAVAVCRPGRVRYYQAAQQYAGHAISTIIVDTEVSVS